MSPEQRARESQILHMHVVDYWFEVDQNGGAGVSRQYTPDGVFHGGSTPLVGRTAIEQFYSWRQDRGARTSRHVVTNFRAEFAGDDHATSWCIMMLLAADGEPIHASRPPIITTDQVDKWVRGSDGGWLIAERNFIPLFMGGEAPTIPPDSIAEQHNPQAQ